MKRTISILLLFAMLLGLLAGCGGNNSAGNSQQGGSSGGDDGAEKVLVFSRSATISGYDPIVNQTGMNRMLNQLFYENLVTSDYSEDGSYEPELATSWETSEDGLTWTFHLREGVKYTDGNPFGSDDVAGVFNRIFNEEKCATQKKNWAMVDSWECPDELTFVMHLNSTISELNMLTALEGLSIWSNERYEEYGEDMFNFDDTMKPVGTGTFIPDKWTVGSDSEFVRNKEWWGIGVLGEESNVDRLIYRPLTEEATRIAGIQTGELDWVDNVTVEYKERLEGSEGVIVEQLDSSLFVYMLFAADRGIFQDKNARLAAYYAIDRELLATTIAGGGEGANWPCPSTCIGFDKDAACEPRDLKKAKAYLAETDYAGEELVLVASNGLFARSKEIYQAVASMLTEAGLNINLQVLDNASVSTIRNNKEYDLHITNVICGNNPKAMLDCWIYDTHKGGYVNEEMFDLIQKGYAESDPSKAAEYLHDAMAMEEVAPVTGLYRGYALIAYRDGISNFDFCDSKNYFNFSHVQKD